MNLKYCIDTAENKNYMDEMTKELLTFGVRYPSPTGGSYYLGDDGTPWTERPRETWITCRMVHVYSIGYMLTGEERYGQLADSGLRGLQGELRDKENGGWFAGVNADGSHLPLKQCYAHAFVILAATSALLAKREGAEELLEDALAVYDKYFWNEELGLACDTWDTEFAKLDTYRGINANMHTVEAFLAVADATGKEEYRVRAGRIIEHVIAWAKENNYRIPEHFTEDWKVDLEKNKEKPDDPFKPYGATPGHGIEWARLIVQWATATFASTEHELADYVKAACNLYDRAIEDGWNSDGARGIVYTTDWSGKPVVHDRMHWTLAEAINTAAVLYRISGQEKYEKLYAQLEQYLDEEVRDYTYGSWYHQLDENNRLKGTVWPGKSDLYHAFQATLIPYCPCETSISKAICIKSLQ